MSQTLLEKAKASQGKSNLKINEESIELAVAWGKGEISLDAVKEAMGTNGTSVYVFLARALREYIKNN